MKPERSYQDNPLLTLNQGQRGMSLVELMIAIVLGLFLIWGVMQSFLSSRQVYRMQQGLGRIQENGRLAQEFLGYDIRNAGDYGCASGDNFIRGDASTKDNNCAANTGSPGVDTTATAMAAINMISQVTTDNDYQNAVMGWNNVAGNPVGGTVLIPAPLAGTDVLQVHLAQDIGTLAPRAGTPGAPATGALAAGAGSNLAALNPNLLLTGPATVEDTDNIAISDCATLKIFGVAANSGLPLANRTAITLDAVDAIGATPQRNYCVFAGFQQGASVRLLSTVYYYVAPSADNTTTSLWKQTSAGPAVELLEGVEDMQLQFGVDNNADGIVDAWKNANLVNANEWTGWDMVGGNRDTNVVRAVRYTLLLRSEDGVLGQVQSIQHPMLNGGAAMVGGPGNAGDRRLRQVFTSTIGIRSRLIFQ